MTTSLQNGIMYVSMQAINGMLKGSNTIDLILQAPRFMTRWVDVSKLPSDSIANRNNTEAHLSALWNQQCSCLSITARLGGQNTEARTCVWAWNSRVGTNASNEVDKQASVTSNVRSHDVLIVPVEPILSKSGVGFDFRAHSASMPTAECPQRYEPQQTRSSLSATLWRGRFGRCTA